MGFALSGAFWKSLGMAALGGALGAASQLGAGAGWGAISKAAIGGALSGVIGLFIPAPTSSANTGVTGLGGPRG